MRCDAFVSRAHICCKAFRFRFSVCGALRILAGGLATQRTAIRRRVTACMCAVRAVMRAGYFLAAVLRVLRPAQLFLQASSAQATASVQARRWTLGAA